MRLGTFCFRTQNFARNSLASTTLAAKFKVERTLSLSPSLAKHSRLQFHLPFPSFPVTLVELPCSSATLVLLCTTRIFKLSKIASQCAVWGIVNQETPKNCHPDLQLQSSLPDFTVPSLYSPSSPHTSFSQSNTHTYNSLDPSCTRSPVSKES